MSIFIGEGLIDYSAMQGPCADGYHVPLKDEWDNLYGILTNTFGLPSNTSTFKTYLKMPLAGYRDNNGSITYQGSIGCYWTSTYSNTTWTWAYYLNIEERDGYTGVRPAGATANGYSIRPFKDTPVEPDNTWTTLYDGSSTAPGAGVFRNSSLGIMSISGDGDTWITIADKNLGAKVTYGGNAAVSTNSGNYYQRGNNYGFPFTGSVTTSGTQVDATNYGPGNYYESSTFITRSTTPFGWDSSTNQNLRGGVTGIVKKSNIKDIFIGEGVDDYSAMQGPAPDGFHVPLNTERQSVKDVRTALGGGSSDGTNFSITLKLPFAGLRSAWDASVSSQGSNGRYWSSSRHSANYAYYLYLFSSYALDPGYNDNRAYGFSVRCFKNSPVVPTLSWTKLYGTSIEAGGIFWNSADGLISLSSDGQTWITMADKNLGATQVWNNGDTLSEANCGKYYQRGNNYGFPFTGTVTTSSTRVDASNYGPGNYYSSSTFITYGGAWDTTDNGNLRGGVTGIVKKGNVKEVYVGNKKVWGKYQYVEYIESSGTQYINTGCILKSNSTIEYKITGTPTSSYQAIFGSRGDGGDGMHCTSLFNNSTMYFVLGGFITKPISSFNLSSPATFIISPGEAFYNGSSIGTRTVNYTAPSIPAYIFARNYNGVNFPSSIRLYYFRIYEGTNIVRDFIPCYRMSDGAIGLYDTVGDEFYTNAGTGTFTKGPDVN